MSARQRNKTARAVALQARHAPRHHLIDNCIRQCGCVNPGLVNKPPGTSGLRSYQRQPAPTQTLQPATPACLLHLRADQHPMLSRIQNLLRPKTCRRQTAQPSGPRAGSPPRQRPLGSAARSPTLPSQPARIDRSGRLTNRLRIAALERHGVRATFFVLGRELARTPWLGRTMTEQGHEVAVHGWDHRCLLRRGPSAVYDDLARTVDAVQRATGVRPRWVRAPYGVFSGPSVLAARRLHLTPVLCTCWGADWTRRASPASVAATVVRGLRGGGTILLHDSDVAAVPGSWRSALGALPAVLDHCRERGWAVGPLRDHRPERNP